MQPISGSRPWGITVVATLMILFGVAEVFTGLVLGPSLGVSTADSTVFAYEGPAIGALYVIGGLLLLTGMAAQTMPFTVTMLAAEPSRGPGFPTSAAAALRANGL